jgi:hypothetical protein
MITDSDRVNKTTEVMRTTLALVRWAQRDKGMLQETFHATIDTICRSLELIRETDRTLAKWGTLAAPPPRHRGPKTWLSRKSNDGMQALQTL